MSPFCDFVEIDRTAFCQLGLSPADVDRLSWRDYWVMLAGARDKDRATWQHTAMITQAVMNHGGNGLRKPQALTHLYNQMFELTASTEPMDGGRVLALLSSIATKHDADRN
jgi:hypothetical protein